jgi:HSP20 family protein
MVNLDLFREAARFQRQIDEVFRGLGGRRLFDQTFTPDSECKRSPRINLRGDDENFYLAALLPGMAAEDLEMTVRNNTLTIAGERKSEEGEGASATWYRKECGAGKFLRTVELPADIDPDRVSAEYKDGILRVTLARAEGARPKRIEVKTT